LFAIEEEYEKTDYASQKHLISLMYSKGLLDNEGNVLMIPRNYYYDIELIENDNETITKPKTEPKGYNYYNYKTGKMLIQSYKTAPAYGPIKITLSNYTIAVIKKSLELKQRKWLFATTSNDKYYNSTSFGTAIANVLRININQIRRAFVNYHIFVADLGRVKVAILAKHSVVVNESTYTTAQSNIATKNILYDENVINKKVNVKISKGTNKGKTLGGIVTRSLKPDRHKFAYSIKFNENDNQANEKANKIPGTGITLYKELVPPAPLARKGKGKGNKGNKGNSNTSPPPTRKKTPPPPTRTNLRRSGRKK
jgi:hypothetical protein